MIPTHIHIIAAFLFEAALAGGKFSEAPEHVRNKYVKRAYEIEEAASGW